MLVIPLWLLVNENKVKAGFTLLHFLPCNIPWTECTLLSPFWLRCCNANHNKKKTHQIIRDSLLFVLYQIKPTEYYACACWYNNNSLNATWTYLVCLPWAASFKLMHNCVQLVEIHWVPFPAISRERRSGMTWPKSIKILSKVWWSQLQCVVQVRDEPGGITVVKSDNFFNEVRISIILQFFQLDKLLIQISLQ